MHVHCYCIKFSVVGTALIDSHECLFWSQFECKILIMSVYNTMWHYCLDIVSGPTGNASAMYDIP